MKAVRVFLLVLIIIGIGLLITQNYWVPSVVNWILSKENSSQVLQMPTQKSMTHLGATSTASQKIISTSEANGAEDNFHGKVLKIEGNNLYQVQVLDTATGNPKGTVLLKDTTTTSHFPIILGHEYSFTTAYNLPENWYVIERAYDVATPPIVEFGN